jgi:hypothetical protein
MRRTFPLFLIAVMSGICWPGARSQKGGMELTGIWQERKKRCLSQTSSGFAFLFGCVGQQRDVARDFHSARNGALVFCAGAGGTPWQDLEALGDVLLQKLRVLVVHRVQLVLAKVADLFAALITVVS